ncbi:MAG: hypothetical protein HN919_08300 [Verrucomicrobia bacterium]|nr:hypothetical protein [Verrucomicrobiota bacterium]MBT7066286.1 hypothetical protein [Verrucomicrobiota bacterium]MBT7699652.1 hypothetical protein [Verrucomicrobiota bacterium]
MSAQDCVALFPQDQIPLILDTVLDCASTLRKKSPSELENHLSTRLVKRLQVDPRMRGGPFVVCPEYQVLDESIDDAKHKGHIDICFVTTQGSHTYFAIEAKRLHVTFGNGKWTSLVGEYVAGNQGMMCFVTSKYSASQRAGAMLGYVFDGDTGRARDGISKAIDSNRKKLKLAGKNGLIQSGIVQRAERVDETRHQFGHRPFTIYHLLVSV